MPTTQIPDDIPGILNQETPDLPATSPVLVQQEQAERQFVLDTHSAGLLQRVVTLVVILVPFAALVTAMVYAWGWGLGWVELAIFAVMYAITGFGITVGYHRLFTHKSFSTGRTLTALLGIFGSMAVEGPLIRWVAFHRCHHQHSDDHNDPHSPHAHGSGMIGTLKGFFQAHMGWLFVTSDTGLERYVTDLRKDRLISAIHKLFPVWMILGLAIPALAGGLITMSWRGALLGLIWGGLVRVFFVHHVTWSVNSVCHLWGSKPYQSHDESRNNAIVGVLALGEGWHNNHHAFPTSARHGLKWWQFDASWVVIRSLEKMRLVWDVRVPSAERLAAKRA